MARAEVHIDQKGVGQALESPEAQAFMRVSCAKIAQRATASGAGFRTKRQFLKGVQVRGGKSPRYAYRIKRGEDGARGVVYTENYAAILHNSADNALLKARG